jgi:hypothetical protein
MTEQAAWVKKSGTKKLSAAKDGKNTYAIDT